MKDNPRIIVLHLKEIIYTGIFLVLGILLIVLMICMFNSNDDKNSSSSGGELDTVQTASVSNTPVAANETTSTAISNNQPETSSAAISNNQAETSSSAISNSQTETSSQNVAENPVTTADSQNTSSNTYVPGVYTSSLVLNNSSLELEVCVDSNHINSISINNLDESVTTMYPLMANSINDLSNQIVTTQSLDNINYTEDCRYTYIILLDAIKTTLNKAKP